MGVPIHRIVCSALNGLPSTDQHVVDHIDTDRANNRPEYLRWFPRLENGLLNETTVRRIVPAFGSIEAFLEDPSKPINKTSFPDVSWMRTLTKEESARTKSRFEARAKSGSVPSGGAIVKDALVVLTRTAEADPIKDPAFAMITHPRRAVRAPQPTSILHATRCPKDLLPANPREFGGQHRQPHLNSAPYALEHLSTLFQCRVRPRATLGHPISCRSAACPYRSFRMNFSTIKSQPPLD